MQPARGESATCLVIPVLPPLVHQWFPACTYVYRHLAVFIKFDLLIPRRSAEETVLSCEPSVVLVTGGDQASLACPPPP